MSRLGKIYLNLRMADLLVSAIGSDMEVSNFENNVKSGMDLTECTHCVSAIRGDNVTYGMDGDQYYYLIGDDLQSGDAGFGDTIECALADFIKNTGIRRIK